MSHSLTRCMCCYFGFFFFQTSFPDLIPNNSNKKIIKNKKGETSSPALSAAEVVKNKCHICFVQRSLWGGKKIPGSICHRASTGQQTRLPSIEILFSWYLTPISPPVSSCLSPSLCLLPEPHRDADRWTLWLWDIKPYLERTVGIRKTLGFWQKMSKAVQKRKVEIKPVSKRSPSCFLPLGAPSASVGCESIFMVLCHPRAQHTAQGMQISGFLFIPITYPGLNIPSWHRVISLVSLLQ